MKRNTLIAILALALIVRFVAVWTAPVFTTVDEAAHYSYAKWIQLTSELPPVAWSAFASEHSYIDPHLADMNRVYGFQNYQNPGYYMLAAATMIGSHSMVFDSISTDDMSSPKAISFQVQIIRFASMLLVMGGLIALMLVVDDRWGLAAFAMLPGFVVISSTVTNQCLMIAAACWLCFGLRRDILAIVLVSLFALVLAKITGLAVAVALCAFWVWRREWRYVFGAIPIIAIGGMVTANRMGLAEIETLYWWKPNLLTAWDRVSEAVVTGVLHPNLHIDDMGYVTGIIALAGLVVIGPWIWRRIRCAPLSVYAVGAYTIMAIWAVFSLSHTFSQGRLLYAAVPFLLVNGGGIITRGEHNEKPR